jgi:hypothetical protein
MAADALIEAHAATAVVAGPRRRPVQEGDRDEQGEQGTYGQAEGRQIEDYGKHERVGHQPYLDASRLPSATPMRRSRGSAFRRSYESSDPG